MVIEAKMAAENESEFREVQEKEKQEKSTFKKLSRKIQEVLGITAQPANQTKKKIPVKEEIEKEFASPKISPARPGTGFKPGTKPGTGIKAPTSGAEAGVEEGESKRPGKEPGVEVETGLKEGEAEKLLSAEKIREEEEKGREKGFFIDLGPREIKLPPIERKEKIDIRYPLMPPYAFVHIYWDKEEQELVYELEEPPLSDQEKELLKLIQMGLEEMINISYIRAAKAHLVMEYLERNVQTILIELGTKISKKVYKKMMYYIFRNSLGLDEIEPLMHDYHIEDIECNGTNFPLYLVHRKYGNMRTNIKFETKEEITEFVEKLAQKCGRYISFAQPLLDGTLPDGSRVNATYSEDVTTRGPTFTIRKFTKEPWAATNLIALRTADPLIFAYLWMAVEFKFNLMIIGETASGKTTFLNALAHFIPEEARICSIEDTREINMLHENWLPSVTRAGFGLPGMVGRGLGEINLFDLLKETFRQNPDYVIVGETRGEETYVMFQGMASGHPSMGTFHAANVESLIKRLETPPINLSPSLVEALDVICVITHIKTPRLNIRRIKEVDEIISVRRELGKAEVNPLFVWEPVNDEFKFNENSYLFQRMAREKGLEVSSLKKELARRARFLERLYDKKILDLKKFMHYINMYHKSPARALREMGLK